MTALEQDKSGPDLSTPQRLQQAQAFLESVRLEAEADPFTPEQLAEFDRRLAEIDSGREILEPWETIRDRLLKQR